MFLSSAHWCYRARADVHVVGEGTWQTVFAPDIVTSYQRRGEDSPRLFLFIGTPVLTWTAGGYGVCILGLHSAWSLGDLRQVVLCVIEGIIYIRISVCRMQATARHLLLIFSSLLASRKTCLMYYNLYINLSNYSSSKASQLRYFAFAHSDS
jgi:predicted RNase H-like nuclease